MIHWMNQHSGGVMEPGDTLFVQTLDYCNTPWESRLQLKLLISCLSRTTEPRMFHTTMSSSSMNHLRHTRKVTPEPRTWWLLNRETNCVEWIRSSHSHIGSNHDLVLLIAQWTVSPVMWMEHNGRHIRCRKVLHCSVQPDIMSSVRLHASTWAIPPVTLG
jgi:hypothetical protein